MQRPDIAEHLPIKPLRLILGVIACIGIAATLFTLSIATLASAAHLTRESRSKEELL